MKEENTIAEQPKEKKSPWGNVLYVFVFGIVAYSVDWAFLKGAITEYPLNCPADYQEGNGCYAHSPLTYYPNKGKQIVIRKSEFSIETLTKCTVIDRKNWECKWDDESGVFGFNSGQFHSNTLWSKTIPIEEMIKADAQREYVSRWRWLIERFNLI